MQSTPRDCSRQMPGTKVAPIPLCFSPISAQSQWQPTAQRRADRTGLHSTTFNSGLLNGWWRGFSVDHPHAGRWGHSIRLPGGFGCSAFLQPRPKEPHSKTHRRELRSKKSHSQDKDAPTQEGFREITSTPEQSAATSSPNLELWVLLYRLRGRLTARPEMTF